MQSFDRPKSSGWGTSTGFASLRIEDVQGEGCTEHTTEVRGAEIIVLEAELPWLVKVGWGVNDLIASPRGNHDIPTEAAAHRVTVGTACVC